MTFTRDDSKVIIADKSGDVYSFPVIASEVTGQGQDNVTENIETDDADKSGQNATAEDSEKSNSNQVTDSGGAKAEKEGDEDEDDKEDEENGDEEEEEGEDGKTQGQLLLGHLSMTLDVVSILMDILFCFSSPLLP